MTVQPEFVYTALTRCTGKLVLYGNTAAIEKFFRISGTAITTIEELTNVRAFDDLVVETKPPENQLTVFKQDVAEDLASEALTIKTLEKVLRPVNPPDMHYMCDPNMPAPQDGVIKTTKDQLQPPLKDNEVYVFPKTHEFIRHQVSDDSRVTVETQVKRYTKKNKRMRHRTEKYSVEMMLRGLSKALYGNDHSIWKLKRHLKCTEQELRKAFMDYLERLNNKMVGGQEQKIWEELGSPMDFYDEVLTFINKRQGKFDMADAFDSKLKAGQGVAAFSKKVNLIFAAYATLLLDKMRQIAKDNGRNIIFATHGSDEDISKQVAFMESISKDGYVYGCNDFAEWDASFLRFLTKVTHTLVTMMGCPPMLIGWFTQYREQWVMININKLGSTVLYGKQKQFSGSPFTIAENTICNCGLVYAIFQIDDEQYSIFKGDDSAIKCKSMKLTDAGKELLARTGHTTKVHCDSVGEFAGFVITPAGLFPDLIRKAAKFFGKAYRDEKHFLEAKESAFACTQVVFDQAHLEMGLRYSVNFYEGKVNAEELRTMYYTLKNSQCYKFSELVVEKKTPFIPDMSQLERVFTH